MMTPHETRMLFESMANQINEAVAAIHKRLEKLEAQAEKPKPKAKSAA